MNTETHKVCPSCKELKPRIDFYKSKQSYCKSCNGLRLKTKYREFKQVCVNYLGGKCKHCGYDSYLGALEFHHTNPQEKEFALSKYSGYVLNEKVKKELDKCILLCSNCHKEIHRAD